MAVDFTMPVLVVDDHSAMVLIIRALLNQLGFENVDDAADPIGRRGGCLRLIQHGRPSNLP